MAAGTSPVFVATPKNYFLATGLNANTALDGTGSNVILIATAGANGSKIEQVLINHMGTNIASVVRFFVNNGSAVGTATNNALIHEEAMAANTLSQTAASVPNVWNAALILQSGYKLYVTIGTAVASGYMIHAQGGDY